MTFEGADVLLIRRIFFLGGEKKVPFLKLKHVPQKHAFIIIGVFVPVPAIRNAKSIINWRSVQRWRSGSDSFSALVS